jgi:hypothetical protein
MVGWYVDTPAPQCKESEKVIEFKDEIKLAREREWVTEFHFYYRGLNFVQSRTVRLSYKIATMSTRHTHTIRYYFMSCVL